MQQIENDLNCILNSSKFKEPTKGKHKINFKDEIERLNFKY